jgi:hypothetical protein
MSPLRRWMENHGHPGWYSWLVVVGSSLTSTLVAVFLAGALIEQERSQRKADQLVLCEVIVIQDDSLKDPTAPPRTEAGRKLSRALSVLREKYECDGR